MGLVRFKDGFEHLIADGGPRSIAVISVLRANSGCCYVFGLFQTARNIIDIFLHRFQHVDAPDAE